MTPGALARPNTPLRQYLFDLTLHGIKLGLENIQALVRAAGDPHFACPVIHVGGTNGKGSVVAMLAAMFERAGYRTAQFTSPHLIDVSERFLVDAEPIPEPALEENIAFFRDAARRIGCIPTFFEMNTAIAFRYFAQARADIALIEVGMGGRFDSTNVVQPLACGITNIDLEHTAYLGDTIAKIAVEKAGIIKAGVTAVTAELNPDALGVFHRRAAEVDAPLLQLGRDFDYRLQGTAWDPQFSYVSALNAFAAQPLALPGRYQGDNAAVACALAETAMPHFPAMVREHIQDGLTTVRWPCRAERVLDDPPVFIDVAHNAAGARRIADLFEECVIVFSASSDKDAASMLAALQPRARHLILTQFDGKRATPVQELADKAGPGSVEISATLPDAVRRGIACATPDCPLLITGSIYTAGEARSVLIQEFGARPLRF
ncbi:MAG: bifunctional folylpolyglutamate synthase/dihydrofolate synthase [Candidatus Hydrogenedentes bacterium]|nr:bifunctional folylpolyglutamate synthase/dihydrofolate synthase [Candidatus Hydrogenedentota bacterium]